ncbi:MAG: hypothetical protein R3C62_14140 [Chloroflexota bacterium]
MTDSLQRFLALLCIIGFFLVGTTTLASSTLWAKEANSTAEIYLPYIAKPATIKSQITKRAIELPIPLESSAGSWCTWGGCSIGPRLYHAPLPNNNTLIGWTDQNGNGHVTLATATNVTHWNYSGTPIRGLVGHEDNSFAVLLWNPTQKVIKLSKRSATNQEIWTTNLNSSIAVADFWLGDGRLTYGNNLYAAYFTVKGTAGGFTGHHGDQMSYVDSNGNKLPGNFPDGWDWGCSHSMAQLISYHPSLEKFAAVCSSDCFPAASIHWVNASHQIYQGAGNCGGNVSTQLGQMALGNDSWKLVFNATAQPCCEGKGIALATLTSQESSHYTWLTNTQGAFERDPIIARLGANPAIEKYVVGWLTTNNSQYQLGIIDAVGHFLVSPENVSTAGISWGNRDDSFRTRSNGTVSWVQGDAIAQVITLFIFDPAPFVTP